MSYLTWPLFFVSLPFDSYETDMRVQGFIILCAAVLCVAASCSESPSVDIKYDSGQLDEHKDAWRRFNSVGNDDSVIIYTRPVLRDAIAAGDTLCALLSDSMCATTCVSRSGAGMPATMPMM